MEYSDEDSGEETKRTTRKKKKGAAGAGAGGEGADAVEGAPGTSARWTTRQLPDENADFSDDENLTKEEALARIHVC